MNLPLILEPEALKAALDYDKLLVVDLSSEANYLQGHVPGAIHMPFQKLMCGEPPAPGRLPNNQCLQQIGANLGLADDIHVIAYDDEGGGWAGRFIWTLEVMGHKKFSYLNGGIHAWRGLGLSEQNEQVTVPRSEYTLPNLNRSVIAETDDILAELDNDKFVVLDARSPEEYRGEKVFSARGGHIPGAINCDWVNLMDRDRNLRIRTDAESFLAGLGINKDQQIVTHCQSHHRSGLTYLIGKSLGFSIRAYHGSWSEWGNRTDTPVEN